MCEILWDNRTGTHFHTYMNSLGMHHEYQLPFHQELVSVFFVDSFSVCTVIYTNSFFM